MRHFHMLLVSIACLILHEATAADPVRPHLVVFIADDLSWKDVPLHGAAGIRMPNLEAMAKDGITLSHAFVNSPSCAPSRAALLTGLDPVRNGALFNHQRPEARHRLWPSYFKELGYQVVAIGKVAHYAQVKGMGFDYASRHGYHEQECIDHAVEWLAKRNDERPLCLLVGTNWPHVPWPERSSYDPATLPIPAEHPETPLLRQWRARYAEAVTMADGDLGKIRTAVRTHLGKALMLFTADHGSQFPFHKWNCYDGGIRTPLVATWEGRIAAGSRSDALVSWVDLLPTLLDAAGQPLAEGPHGAGGLSGRSFLAVLNGSATVHREIIAVSHSGDGQMNDYPIRAVRDRRWKYIRNLASDREFHSHVDRVPDTSGYFEGWLTAAGTDPASAAFLARYVKRPAEELYDLAADPDELHDLATDPAHAATLSRLRDELVRWMATTGDLGLETEAARRPKAKPASGGR